MNGAWGPEQAAVHLDIGADHRSTRRTLIGVSILFFVTILVWVGTALTGTNDVQRDAAITMAPVIFTAVGAYTLVKLIGFRKTARDHGMIVDRYGLWWREGTELYPIRWQELAGAGLRYTRRRGGRNYRLEIIPADIAYFQSRHPELAPYLRRDVYRISIPMSRLPLLFEDAVRTCAPRYWRGTRHLWAN